MTGYGMTVVVDAPFDEADRRTRAALADQGFGVLTEIDVAGTLRAKLGVERAPLKILGACNPGFAHRALELDPSVAVLLPCNVVLEATDGSAMTIATNGKTDAGLAPALDKPPLGDEVTMKVRRGSREISVRMTLQGNTDQ